MTEKNGPTPKGAGEFDRFKQLAGKLVRVPKKEADKKEAAYQRKKARRRPKPA